MYTLHQRTQQNIETGKPQYLSAQKVHTLYQDSVSLQYTTTFHLHNNVYLNIETRYIYIKSTHNSTEPILTEENNNKNSTYTLWIYMVHFHRAKTPNTKTQYTAGRSIWYTLIVYHRIISTHKTYTIYIKKSITTNYLYVTRRNLLALRCVSFLVPSITKPTFYHIAIKDG